MIVFILKQTWAAFSIWLLFLFLHCICASFMQYSVCSSMLWFISSAKRPSTRTLLQQLQFYCKLNPCCETRYVRHCTVQGGPIKNVPLYFCLYLRQLSTDLQNFFTATLCGQFAIMWLLYIPPHHKCVFALPCEIWVKYAYIMIITN